MLVIYYINDNAKVDNKNFQLMKCHVCYFNLIIVVNSKTQLRKGIIHTLKAME
jgi:hypothetical protein